MDHEERFDDLLFNCPNCGKPRRIEQVQLSATVTTPIQPFRDNEQESFDAEMIGTEMHVTGGIVDRYQCEVCAFTIHDHEEVDERITSMNDLIEVVRTTDAFVTPTKEKNHDRN